MAIYFNSHPVYQLNYSNSKYKIIENALNGWNSYSSIEMLIFQYIMVKFIMKSSKIFSTTAKSF